MRPRIARNDLNEIRSLHFSIFRLDLKESFHRSYEIEATGWESNSDSSSSHCLVQWYGVYSGWRRPGVVSRRKSRGRIARGESTIVVRGKETQFSSRTESVVTSTRAKPSRARRRRRFSPLPPLPTAPCGGEGARVDEFTPWGPGATVGRVPGFRVGRPR